MENWFINPVSGVQIALLSGGWLVATPGRPILHYDFGEMEYVVI